MTLIHASKCIAICSTVIFGLAVTAFAQGQAVPAHDSDASVTASRTAANAHASAIEAWRIEKKYVARLRPNTPSTSAQSAHSVITTKSFIVNLCADVVIGNTYTAGVDADRNAWSISTCSLQIGKDQVVYPLSAMVKSSDGYHTLYPGILKASTDIKAGETLHSDGYQIDAKRPIKAGDSIPVLWIENSLLSAEGDDGGPWFTAFKDDVGPR